MACELLLRGIRYRIVDQMEAPSTSIRAHGLQPRSMEVFDNMGIVDQIVARGKQPPEVIIYDGDRVITHFGSAPLKHVPYPYVWFIQQPAIEAILRETLQERGGIIEHPCRVTDLTKSEEGVTVTLDGPDATEAIQAHWVIGCDGAHSSVRRRLGIPFEGQNATQVFLIAEVDLDWNRNREAAHAWLHADGMFTAAYFDEVEKWQLFVEFGVLDDTHPLPPLSVELFERLLRERTGDTTTRISHPKELSHFTIKRRLAKDYRKGHVFLAGDAAHIHSPAGGLGMNTGIQDAYNLAWKLALVIGGKAAVTLLDTYQEERRPVALAVLKQTNATDHSVFPTNPLMRLVRNHVLLPLMSFDTMLRLITARGTQLSINYRTSSLSHSHQGRLSESTWFLTTASKQPGVKDWLDFRVPPQAGDRAPEGKCLRAADQASTSLFKEWRGIQPHLLLFGGTNHKCSAPMARFPRSRPPMDEWRR